jgi:hypothetical protein
VSHTPQGQNTGNRAGPLIRPITRDHVQVVVTRRMTTSLAYM